MLGIAAAHLLRAPPPSCRARSRAGRASSGSGGPAGEVRLSTSGTCRRRHRMLGEAEQRLDAHRHASARPRRHSRSGGGCRPASRNGSARAGRRPCARPSRAAHRAPPTRRRRRSSPSRRLPASSGGSHSSSAASRASSDRSGRSPDRSGGRRRRASAAPRPASLHGSRARPCRRTPSSRAASIAAGIGAAVLAARRAGSRRAGGRATRADGAGRRIEARPGRRSRSRSANSDLDRRLVDRRGGEDARARRGAADLGDREPGFARERRGRIEPEAAPADAEPVAAGRVAALDDAVGEGQRDAGADLVRSRGEAGAGCARTARDEAQPSLRQPPRRLGAPALLAAPAPQPQLQVRVAAAEPALGEQHRDLGRRSRPSRAPRASISIWARRGGSGSAAMARPCGGRAAAFVDRAERSAAARRASSIAAAGGGSSQRSVARVGHAPDRAIEQQRATGPPPGFPAGRSAAGLRSPPPPTAGRPRPGPCRPARPARCVTAAWLARSVTSRVSPAARS